MNESVSTKKIPVNYNQLQLHIGKWAQYNFGYNVSKVVYEVGTATLHEIAPLMGIGEELGELAEAELQPGIEKVREMQKDAVGDVGIYVLDYTYRAGIQLDQVMRLVPESHPKKHPYHLLLVEYGLLLHANLKRHQGIRGYDRDEVFYPDAMKHLARIIGILDIFAKINFNAGFWELTEETWQHIVTKRNWKMNPETGEPVTQ